MPWRSQTRAVLSSRRPWCVRCGGDCRLTRNRPGGSITSRKPLFEQAGGDAVRFQARRIDHHRIRVRALPRQRGKDSVEDADPASADEAVVGRLQRPVDGGRVAPRQPFADDVDDLRDHPPVIHPKARRAACSAEAASDGRNGLGMSEVGDRHRRFPTFGSLKHMARGNLFIGPELGQVASPRLSPQTCRPLMRAIASASGCPGR